LKTRRLMVVLLAALSHLDIIAQEVKGAMKPCGSSNIRTLRDASQAGRFVGEMRSRVACGRIRRADGQRGTGRVLRSSCCGQNDVERFEASMGGGAEARYDAIVFEPRNGCMHHRADRGPAGVVYHENAVSWS